MIRGIVLLTLPFQQPVLGPLPAQQRVRSILQHSDTYYARLISSASDKLQQTCVSISVYVTDSVQCGIPTSASYALFRTHTVMLSRFSWCQNSHAHQNTLKSSKWPASHTRSMLATSRLHMWCGRSVPPKERCLQGLCCWKFAGCLGLPAVSCRLTDLTWSTCWRPTQVWVYDPSLASLKCRHSHHWHEASNKQIWQCEVATALECRWCGSETWLDDKLLSLAYHPEVYSRWALKADLYEAAACDMGSIQALLKALLQLKYLQVVSLATTFMPRASLLLLLTAEPSGMA